MERIIVGTAGHVDHGKTLLTKKLTGIDTDRLKEEKERGISIELGFAPLTLPSGTKVGLVDVPGHERFIKTMLAGVAGMDLVLLVIAADEGVMPQTREHLDIINLLEVKKGVVVITKADMVDEDWLELVQQEIMDALDGSVLEQAPMVVVSAVTGRGMTELLEVIDRLAQETPPKEAAGKARMPVDRIFTITGFGTVATGTLWSGKLKVGDIVDILPEERSARVRTLQVHGEKVEEATAGQRVAVNLAGIELDEFSRGSVLAEPGLLQVSFRVDVSLRLLEHTGIGLNQQARIRIHHGTREVLGRVNLLDREELLPGENCFCQINLEEPLTALRGDHYVIRSYSPMITIGGGIIVDAVPIKHKRYREEVIANMEVKSRGNPKDLVQQFLSGPGLGMFTAQEIGEKTGMGQALAETQLAEVIQDGYAIDISGDGTKYFLAKSKEADWLSKTKDRLAEFHQKYPLRAGMPKEEIKSREFPFLPAKLFNLLIDHWEKAAEIRLEGQALALATFSIRPPEHLVRARGQIEKKLLAEPFAPPAWDEIAASVGLKEQEKNEVFAWLQYTQTLVKLPDDIVMHRDAIEAAQEKITDFLKKNGTIQLAQARDVLNTSRKYALPMLEYFDQIRVTKRKADFRVLF